ncbi:MAG: anthranilate synthase component I [Lentisphaerae bacterium]|mgnify:CR=1 FL=1|jgi:anthranilate synthase component I|nr:anthranilate synthase component I [Lentisphaerota bacterium]MBT4823219.1 anthranilate synthase component I [Lentisphaerota bacterium]MBT5610729.1 anthranilate synthase component I [Lentisphaerota bacterium]MBT7054298.1 anthranilate synthase component I [Lentisphaerota bacterium]MBT7844359.1 anthranilate synthase component I [Lentisphaerota bacterium]
MFSPDFDTFRTLCEKGTVVPVFREHLADMETPVSAFARFVGDDHAFLLESVEGGERWGRYSFIGLHPRAIFSVEGGVARLTTADGVTELDSPEGGFTALRDVLAKDCFVPVPGLPRFVAGAVGYLAYETAGEFERLPRPKGDSDAPTTCMMLTDEMCVFDNVRHTVKVVACAHPSEFPSLEEAYESACSRIERVESRLREPNSTPRPKKAPQAVAIESNMTREQYCDIIRRAKEQIVDGEIIQVVLSQRFSTQLPADPLTVYRALRLINPSPYTFFLKFGSRMLVGSSPEVMVRLTGDCAELRPIAGTRPRGKTEQEDRELADSLLGDEKERAEHVMLVDLGRNDLGRVAVAGSVQVRDFMTIERYSHVMHIVSNVQATLREDCDAFDLVRATFPAGTLSGAPKVRAMEIVNELEPQSRGAYGGAVGYIGYDGNMDLAITIRTVEIDGDRAAVQAGAGIVYDSDPDREYDETVHKAKGMVRALELAASGLELS